MDAWALLVETSAQDPQVLSDGTLYTPPPTLHEVEGATEVRLSGTKDKPYWIVIVNYENNQRHLQLQHDTTSAASVGTTTAFEATANPDPTKGIWTNQVKHCTHLDVVHLFNVFLKTRHHPEPLGTAKSVIWLPYLPVKLDPLKIQLENIPATFAMRLFDRDPNSSHKNTALYNLTEFLDMNICFHFWLKKDGCKKGRACLYRHCPPNADEPRFLYTIGATKFLWNLYKTWKASYAKRDLRKFPFTRLWLTRREVTQEHLPWEVLEWDEEKANMWPILETINKQWGFLWEGQQHFQGLRTHDHGPGPSEGPANVHPQVSQDTDKKPINPLHFFPKA